MSFIAIRIWLMTLILYVTFMPYSMSHAQGLRFQFKNTLLPTLQQVFPTCD